MVSNLNLKIGVNVWKLAVGFRKSHLKSYLGHQIG